VKELHAKSEVVFVAEAGDKARVWWNQSGNSEAAKMKSAWFEAAKKRAAAGGAPENPRRSACLLPLPLCKPLALAVVLKTALICTCALRERPHRATKTHITYYNTENREQAHTWVFCYWLAATALLLILLALASFGCLVNCINYAIRTVPGCGFRIRSEI